MDSSKRVCSSIFLLFMAFVIHHHQFSDAYQFNLGWVVNPPEPYNTWAGRMRFQVNDTLLFRYNQGSNSVLEVNGNDYSQCNTNNPITKMEDGNSIFKFNRTGPFYFISGNKTFCDQGQKITIVVLAIRNGPPPVPVAPVPAPVAPVPAPVAPVPVPAPIAPVPAPVAPVPAPAVSPASPPAPAVAPASQPAPAPGGVTPPAVPAPGGVTPPAVPGSPGTDSPPTPPSSDSPPGTTPGSGNSSGASFTTATALMSAVAIVLCTTLSG